MQFISDRKEYLNSLPKRRVGCAVILLNSKKEALILNLTYRDYWGLVGGHADSKESIIETVTRETKEEIDLDIKDLRLLTIATSDNDIDNGLIEFFFYGGTLSDEMIGKIKVQEDEASEYKFVKLEELKNYLNPRIGSYIHHTIKSLQDGKLRIINNSDLVG